MAAVIPEPQTTHDDVLLTCARVLSSVKVAGPVPQASDMYMCASVAILT